MKAKPRSSYLDANSDVQHIQLPRWKWFMREESAEFMKE
jgi:hypothetical protein